MKTMFTIEQRAAIGELVEFAQSFGESGEEAIRLLCAVACERAANIIRGEVQPRTWSDKDVLDFARFWNIQERAKFNPKPRKRRRHAVTRRAARH